MNTKRNIIRTAALSTGLLIAATTAQAAELDNREVGHFATAQTENVDVRGLATGLQNGEIGHFAARVGSIDTSPVHTVYGNTEWSLR